MSAAGPKLNRIEGGAKEVGAMFKPSFNAMFNFWSAAAIFFISMLFAQSAFAFGIGGYVNFGAGNVEFEESWDAEDPWARLKNEGDVTFYGFGFLLDTAVAKNRVFNYRLQVGYEDAEFDIDTVVNRETGADISNFVADFKLDVDQIVFDNTFGFGIVRKENLRLWFGPQIRVGYISGNGDLTDISGTRLELDFDGVIFGFAPVVGANFNFSNNLTLGLDLGYRFSLFAGELEKSGLGQWGGDDFDGNMNTYFINFALIYRFNDSY